MISSQRDADRLRMNDDKQVTIHTMSDSVWSMDMSRSARPTLTRSRVLLLGIFVVCVTLFVSLTFARQQVASITSQPVNPPSAPAAVPHFLDLANQGDAGLRTLVIGASNDQLPGTSNAAGYLMANLRSGTLPANAATAVVRTDANCQPDQDGISHCLNELQIGTTILTVQHHHNMQQVPCLTPGETVKLMPLSVYQG